MKMAKQGGAWRPRKDKPQVSSNVDSRVVKSRKSSVATTDKEQVATSAAGPQANSPAQSNDDTIAGEAPVSVWSNTQPTLSQGVQAFPGISA
ncbi:uncharacterized protein BBA_08530 [Beauveria bassiana ARSEF 2860]|uniref:Uncharacterized protein n=1 Tax=Beauveria bassiana (strain ARSEF 2860) TaxID=655819 RepID=J5JFQ4_BEAB2|nr:uncharacterized protein BBA_08530 [Beauveria bassiana ARSEF 2860]EJP62446.1 hypothetical protein BBA_08530 [Beauveria bassiana ARSEF 2860]